ncbi:MAG TPA: hypothetical protein VNH18_21625 [Bryobacteraceae bacterium]|nr:hypothetical protein [Bryobacteraceae bacterium]
MHLTDLAAAPNGTYAVAASGNWAGSLILWLDEKGAVKKTVRTAPFTAMALCFAADGTLWAAGREYQEDGLRNDAPGHNVLRQFDVNGTMLRSTLPVTSFAGSAAHQHPGANRAHGMLSTHQRRIP